MQRRDPQLTPSNQQQFRVGADAFNKLIESFIKATNGRRWRNLKENKKFMWEGRNIMQITRQNNLINSSQLYLS